MTTKAAAKKADKAVKLTGYVVLQLRDGAWWPALDSGQPKVFMAPGKSAAIRAHTGEGPDALVGTWKAISYSAWKGGETTEQETRTARKPLDEGL